MNLKNILERILGNLTHQVVDIETRHLYCRALLTDGRTITVARLDAEEEKYYKTPFEVVWS